MYRFDQGLYVRLHTGELSGRPQTQDAVIRNLEVIGQALKDFGIEVLTEKVPQTPWPQVAGMRNILAHEYLGVDMVMIWDTVQLHLNDLRQALETIQTEADRHPN